MSENWVGTIHIRCDAPEGAFEPDWDDIPPAVQEEIEERGSIPCEGGGNAGPWCRDCYWCDEYEADWEIVTEEPDDKA